MEPKESIPRGALVEFMGNHYWFQPNGTSCYLYANPEDVGDITLWVHAPLLNYVTYPITKRTEEQTTSLPGAEPENKESRFTYESYYRNAERVVGSGLSVDELLAALQHKEKGVAKFCDEYRGKGLEQILTKLFNYELGLTPVQKTVLISLVSRVLVHMTPLPEEEKKKKKDGGATLEEGPVLSTRVYDDFWE